MDGTNQARHAGGRPRTVSGGSTGGKPQLVVPAHLHFLERFNITFLGSAEVPSPKGKDVIENALNSVMAKRRPGHAGTITITQLGIKWIKSGQFNGALYGINRVLYSTSHESSPCFSFIVKDKNVSRYICHCFKCNSAAEADAINLAIGKSFTVMKQTREMQGNVGALQATYQKFEDTKLIKGDLLSTRLDQGQGVDADEAMAALDAGFKLGGWSTPTNVHKPELSPMSPELPLDRTKSQIQDTRIRSNSARSVQSQSSRARSGSAKASPNPARAISAATMQGVPAPEPPVRKAFYNQQGKPVPSPHNSPVLPRAVQPTSVVDPRAPSALAPSNSNPFADALAQSVSGGGSIAPQQATATNHNPFTVDVQDTPATIVPTHVRGGVNSTVGTSIAVADQAQYAQAAFAEVEQLIQLRRWAEASSGQTDLVTHSGTSSSAQVEARNVEEAPTATQVPQLSREAHDSIRAAALDEVNKRIAVHVASQQPSESAPLVVDVRDGTTAEHASASSEGEEVNRSPVVTKDEEKLSPTKLRLKAKREKAAALRAARMGKEHVSTTQSVDDVLSCHDPATVESTIGATFTSENTEPLQVPYESGDLGTDVASELKMTNDDIAEKSTANDVLEVSLPVDQPPTPQLGNLHELAPVNQVTVSKSEQNDPYETEIGDDLDLGGFRAETSATAEQWSAEEKALEDAMREIRARLEAEETSEATNIEEVEEERRIFPGRASISPVALIPSGSATPALDSVDSGKASDEPEQFKSPVAPATGIADLALAIAKQPSAQSGSEVVLPMSIDANLETNRPMVSLADVRPGFRGFTMYAKVIQQVFLLKGVGPHDIGIAEWLIADSTASAILKTVQPATSVLQPGGCYELVGAAVSVVQDKMRITIGHYGGLRSAKNITVPHEVLYKNISTMTVNSGPI